jgi:hypothetical protein
MGKLTVMTGAVAILIGAAAAAAPAAAQGGGAAPGRAGAQTRSADHAAVVLRRDGDRAAPFGTGHQPVLRRDGSRAVPFEVYGSVATPGDEGFHWGDALLGAVGACVLMLFASAALSLVRRRVTAPASLGRPA